jgi:transcriptional regulator with XRE-family HTH domain
VAKTIRSSGHEALLKAIIAARKAAGLTQSGLAKKLNCHQSLIARLESGQRRIDVVELVVVSRAIGIDPAKFLVDVESATDLNHSL